MNDSTTSLSVVREIPPTLTKGEHMYDRGSSQFANRMGESAFFGQRTGAPEGETHQANPGVLRVPPPGGTPGAGIADSGEWVVTSRLIGDMWHVNVFDNMSDAERYYRHMAPYSAVYLTYVLKKDL